VDFSAFAGFDGAVSGLLRGIRSPALTRAMWVATASGDAHVMAALSVGAVVLLWAWGRRRSGVVLAALMAADPLVAGILKALFDRPRPPVSGMLIAAPSDAALPSGHAMATLVFYGSLALIACLETRSIARRVGAIAAAVVAVLLVGASRVVLGVHWPSDVLAGWVFGSLLVAAGWGALALWTRMSGPERRRPVTPAVRARLDALAALVAALGAGALVLQLWADPLLRR